MSSNQLINKQQMQNIYDVAIIGCGIPGLYAAREFVKKGLKVIIFDRSLIIGEPNYSTAGTPKYVVEQFNLPKEGINQDINAIVYATKDKICHKVAKETYGYVLDFRKTKQLLAQEVESLGGEVFWGVNIDLVNLEGEIYSLISGVSNYYAKYVVDASGISSHIGEDMGVEEKINDQLSVGEEYIIKTSSLKLKSYHKAMGLILDLDIAPYGYGWVFDNGDGTYKIGIAEFYIDPKRSLPSIDARLDGFIKHLLGEDNYQICEKHGGAKQITNKYKTLYKGRMLGIGDGVSSLNPFWGEGIRQGLFSAQYAVESIMSDIEDGQGLAGYRKKMNKYHGFKWKVSDFISRQIYKRPCQEVYELVVDYMREYLSAEDAVAIGFEYDFAKLVFMNPVKFLRIALKQLVH
jgi:flavin-dependent dehydrogenase